VDIGRGLVEQQINRDAKTSAMRYTLRKLLPKQAIFGAVLKAGQMIRPFLPENLKRSIPPQAKPAGTWPQAKHARKMLVLDGCVQPTLAPGINAATARVLDRLGISLITAPNAGCCGAVAFHLNAQAEGLDYMRHNIDAWWPFVDRKEVEAIVMTASGCGVTVKEYGHLLNSGSIAQKTKLAFHSPCTLQHGMKIRGTVEEILIVGGFDLTHVPDAHLCCGSAGTYSILQPELSQQLLKNKATALESGNPELIATANIGCLMHLKNGTQKPVKHWMELIDERLSGGA
jgi:glycolate oxidase iron-sulfur subunit